MSHVKSDFILHTYFRSSCSARLRIALNLKNLQYSSVYINLLAGEQQSDDYVAINPSALVPSLRHLTGTESLEGSVLLTQSLAILEYLEEILPGETPLLPPLNQPLQRAQVRALANIIACDIQPVTNLRILSRIGTLGGSREDWAKGLMTEGLEAYERLARKTSGKYSVGDIVSLADVCLVPAVWGAMRFGVDLDALPVVKSVYGEMEKLEGVNRAHWKNQEDTPEGLRH